MIGSQKCNHCRLTSSCMLAKSSSSLPWCSGDDCETVLLDTALLTLPEMIFASPPMVLALIGMDADRSISDE